MVKIICNLKFRTKKYFVTQLSVAATLICLFPQPHSQAYPVFCSLVCIQYNTRRRKSTKKKRGRPGNTCHVNDIWWTRGGYRGDIQISRLQHQAFQRQPKPQKFIDQQYLTSPMRNSLYGLLHTSLQLNTAPPLHPPHVHQTSFT